MWICCLLFCACVACARARGGVPSGLQSEKELNHTFPSQNSFITELISSPPDKRAFILDVGANNGAWGNRMMERCQAAAPTKHVQLIMFEPQHRFEATLRRLVERWGANYIRAAAWTADTNITFFTMRDSRAASVNPRGGGGIERAHRNYSVPGIDFPAFLLRTLMRGDFVLLKLDVEGAEYELLPPLVASGALCSPTHLLIEWHMRSLVGATPKQTASKRQEAGRLRISLQAMLERQCRWDLSKAPPIVMDHEDDASTAAFVAQSKS